MMLIISTNILEAKVCIALFLQGKAAGEESTEKRCETILIIPNTGKETVANGIIQALKEGLVIM